MRASLIDKANEVHLAAELIRLGARTQVLEAETNLSRDRLLKLYREVSGRSASKGMLPYSTDWFLGWMPNIHASLFSGIHGYLLRNAGLHGIEAVMHAYRLYVEHVETNAMTPELSFTRAWTLVRFMQANMLATTSCVRCGGPFVVDPLDLHDRYVCGLCQVPPRAGKTKQSAQLQAAA